MTFDRSDFAALQHKRAAERTHEQRDRLMELVQASVSAERVTGHPDWDRYLSQMQTALESANAAARQAERDLAHPDVVNADAMWKLKLAAAHARGVSEGIGACLDLPVQLLTEGRNARERLNESGDADSDAA